MSGIPIEEDLGIVDVVVIVTLWVLKFFDNGLETLFRHTSEVIYGELMESQFIQRYIIYILFGKCALACAVAFTVDAYNHKFAVAFGGLGLYILTPVLALCMCITEKPIFPVLLLATSTVMFVTSPAAFTLIFNQKRHPVRDQVRRLVSVMEFAEGLLLIVVGVTIPEKAVHNERYSLIASWVVVIPFFFLILTIMERIRKYVSPDRVPEKGAVAIFKGIKHDMGNKAPKTGLSKMNLLFFVFLLLPAFSLTSLGSVVENLKPENDTQFQHPSLKKTITLGQLTVIPVCEVAVSFSPLNELLAEMVVLGLAHIMNIGVLTFLVVRMNPRVRNHRSIFSKFEGDFPQNRSHSFPSTAEQSPADFGDEGGLILDDAARSTLPLPPGPKRFIFYMVNPTPVDLLVADDPQYVLVGRGYNTLLRPYDGFLCRGVNMEEAELIISVIVKPITNTTGGITPITKTITFKENKFYILIITVNGGILDIVVTGDDVTIPKIVYKPILIVQSTFVGAAFWGKKLAEDHELQVTTGTGSTIYIETLPEIKRSLALVVPAGRLTLTVRYVGRDPDIKEKLGVPVSEIITAIEPSSVSIITVHVKSTGGYSFGTYIKFYQNSPPATTPAPPGPEAPDAAMHTTYAVVGATLGLTSVGYIHFFWMGCPVRLRATLYAWFLAWNEILGWLAAYVIGNEIGIPDGILLLSVAVITATWHFAVGWYYNHKIMPEALETKRLASTAFPN